MTDSLEMTEPSVSFMNYVVRNNAKRAHIENASVGSYGGGSITPPSLSTAVVMSNTVRIDAIIFYKNKFAK